MSIKVMTLVWDRSQHRGSDLLVLLALADWADDEGNRIYPSATTVASKCRLNTRAVQYIFKKLVDSGEVSIDGQAHYIPGGRSTNEFHIDVRKLEIQPIARVKAKRVTITGVQSFAPVQRAAPVGVQPAAPNPSVLSTNSDDDDARKRERELCEAALEKWNIEGYTAQVLADAYAIFPGSLPGHNIIEDECEAACNRWIATGGAHGKSPIKRPGGLAIQNLVIRAGINLQEKIGELKGAK